MGLYELETQFDGTFARRATALVEAYSQAVRQEASWLGQVKSSSS